jgi:4-oxalocrotonate tautomerase
MPFIDVSVHPELRPGEAAAVADLVTRAMVDIMGKRRVVTAVRVHADPSVTWTIGGSPAGDRTVYLEARITAGSNGPEEKAQLIAELHRGLNELLGGIAEASYLVIHELPADAWGYGGHTQAGRQAGPG